MLGRKKAGTLCPCRLFMFCLKYTFNFLFPKTEAQIHYLSTPKTLSQGFT